MLRYAYYLPIRDTLQLPSEIRSTPLYLHNFGTLRTLLLIFGPLICKFGAISTIRSASWCSRSHDAYCWVRTVVWNIGCREIGEECYSSLQILTQECLFTDMLVITSGHQSSKAIWPSGILSVTKDELEVPLLLPSPPRHSNSCGFFQIAIKTQLISSTA